ncbi:MAG: hypothetical protein BWX80_03009 [Candidatus Hydrogenedentes bacterium ADurb.Bin101]|nr:MAG: hypothetical protein BWX80_03009 [Candidatus Hydrogenedentes bacterium ADurb.Bin101]
MLRVDFPGGFYGPFSRAFRVLRQLDDRGQFSGKFGFFAVTDTAGLSPDFERVFTAEDWYPVRQAGAFVQFDAITEFHVFVLFGRYRRGKRQPVTGLGKVDESGIDLGIMVLGCITLQPGHEGHTVRQDDQGWEDVVLFIPGQVNRGGPLQSLLL